MCFRALVLAAVLCGTVPASADLVDPAYLVPLLLNNFTSQRAEFKTAVTEFGAIDVDAVSVGLGTSEYDLDIEGSVLALKDRLNSLRVVKIAKRSFVSRVDLPGTEILVTSSCLRYPNSSGERCANSSFLYANYELQNSEVCTVDFSYLESDHGACMYKLDSEWWLWVVWTPHERT